MEAKKSQMISRLSAVCDILVLFSVLSFPVNLCSTVLMLFKFLSLYLSFSSSILSPHFFPQKKKRLAQDLQKMSLRLVSVPVSQRLLLHANVIKKRKGASQQQRERSVDSLPASLLTRERHRINSNFHGSLESSGHCDRCHSCCKCTHTHSATDADGRVYLHAGRLTYCEENVSLQSVVVEIHDVSIALLSMPAHFGPWIESEVKSLTMYEETG